MVTWKREHGVLVPARTEAQARLRDLIDPDVLFLPSTGDNMMGTSGDAGYSLHAKPSQKVTRGPDAQLSHTATSSLVAFEWPEIAVYYAVQGGQGSVFSKDTGICIHRAEDDSTAAIATFMAAWDHSPYGAGWVVPVPRQFFGRHPDPDLFWFWQTAVATIPPLLVSRYPPIRVTGADLACRPVMTRDDPTMCEAIGRQFSDAYLLEKALEMRSTGWKRRALEALAAGKGLPFRGPDHEPFEAPHACGVVGGQLRFEWTREVLALPGTSMPDGHAVGRPTTFGDDGMAVLLQRPEPPDRVMEIGS